MNKIQYYLMKIIMGKKSEKDNFKLSKIKFVFYYIFYKLYILKTSVSWFLDYYIIKWKLKE